MPIDNVRPLHANRDPRFEMPRAGSVHHPVHAQPRVHPNHVDKKPFEAKGHDRQLLDKQNSAALIEVTTQAGIIHTGTIVKRDRYTITLRTHNLANRTHRDVLLFKHAIESIDLSVPAEE